MLQNPIIFNKQNTIFLKKKQVIFYITDKLETGNTPQKYGETSSEIGFHFM